MGRPQGVASLSNGQGRQVHSKEPNLEIISRHVSCQFMHIGKINQITHDFLGEISNALHAIKLFLSTICVRKVKKFNQLTRRRILLMLLIPQCK